MNILPQKNTVFNGIRFTMYLKRYHNAGFSEAVYAFFHCVKSVCIRSFYGPYFPAFGLHT